MKLKNIILSAIVAMSCTMASAQQPEPKTEYVFNPHWYLQLQVGGQYTLGEVSFGDLLSPNVQVGVGYEFNKVVGARLSVNAWKSKAGSNTYSTVDEDGYLVDAAGEYKWDWNYVAPMIEATFNLTNLFCDYNPKRLINVGVFAGIGANIAWGNDDAWDKSEEMAALHSSSENLDYLWDGTACRFAARAGANIDFRISDAVSLGLEVNATTLNDHYNSKKAGNADWYFNGLVGIKINLGKTYTTKTVTPPAPVERVVERIVEKPAPTPAPVVEKPAPVEKKEKLRREIFFTINSTKIDYSDESKIDDIVEYMKKYPEAEVSVTGYADKGTGNNTINDRLAAKRADIVADTLAERGIARDRIKKDSKGSREQPFAENDKNRVTICIAE